MNRLEIVEDPRTDMETLARYLRPPNLRIVEAGCGRNWPTEFDNPSSRLTGIDSDPAALELRTDLEQSILADIREVELPPGEADVVYCAYVLEHVRGADKAMENFVKWLKPGGVLILRIPDRDSVYGFITRITPLWTHIFYKRWIRGRRNAGKPGFGPYPTYHDPIVSRRGIHEFCAIHNCEIEEEYGRDEYLHGPSSWLIKPVSIMLWLLFLGRYDWRYNNLVYVIRKPGKIQDNSKTGLASVPATT